MNVSKRSWHYKLHRYFYTFYDEGPILPGRGPRVDHQPKSLCSYFWSTVLMMVGLPFVLALVIIIIPWVYLYDKTIIPVKNRRAEKRAREGKPPKGESLLLSFAKARKKKLCPLITLVDE